MKIMCKDQATKDLLLKTMDEFPNSLGHISKTNILVFGPDNVDLMFGKDSSVTMIDMETMQKIYNMEAAHRQEFEKLDEFTKARIKKMDQDGTHGHSCGSNGERRREIVLKIENASAHEDWSKRINDVLTHRGMNQETADAIREYLSSLANESGHVTVTEEVLIKLESLISEKTKIALVGTNVLGGRLLASFDEMDERAYIPKLQDTDFGRESGKKSRRPMVTSAKGHPYPLPKSPRGMPRISRTRGR